MATKFYLAEIPDDFPATNVKFENMTKPLLAIPAKMVDGKPITIVGYINAGQKKYKANDYGFVEFNDNGADFAQFKDANMDTRYSVREKVSGDILGYLPLETGELVGIVREKEKPILLLIIAVIAALVLLVALITASLYKMVNKPLDGSGSDASSASSEIVIADGEAYDGTMLTVYDFNRVTFAHHRGIVPPMPAQEGKKAVEKRYVCSANMKLMEYGYIMARDLFDACCKAEYNDFLKTWSALYDCVTEDGKAIS